MNGQLKFLLDSIRSEILKCGKLLAINNTEQRITGGGIKWCSTIILFVLSRKHVLKGASISNWLYNSGFQHFPCLEAYTTTTLSNKGTGPTIFTSAITVSLHDKFLWQEGCFHKFKCESLKQCTAKSPFTLLFFGAENLHTKVRKIWNIGNWNSTWNERKLWTVELKWHPLSSRYFTFPHSLIM
jgi:hypothetical protein